MYHEGRVLNSCCWRWKPSQSWFPFFFPFFLRSHENFRWLSGVGRNLWDKVISECLQQQQFKIAELLEACELTRDPMYTEADDSLQQPDAPAVAVREILGP